MWTDSKPFYDAGYIWKHAVRGWSIIIGNHVVQDFEYDKQLGTIVMTDKMVHEKFFNDEKVGMRVSRLFVFTLMDNINYAQRQVIDIIETYSNIDSQHARSAIPKWQNVLQSLRSQQPCEEPGLQAASLLWNMLAERSY
jgi:hypothetical protein